MKSLTKWHQLKQSKFPPTTLAHGSQVICIISNIRDNAYKNFKNSNNSDHYHIFNAINKQFTESHNSSGNSFQPTSH